MISRSPALEVLQTDVGGFTSCKPVLDLYYLLTITTSSTELI
jgi:hypothetical protein